MSSGDAAFPALIQRGGRTGVCDADTFSSEAEIILEIMAFNGALCQEIYTKPPQIVDLIYVQ